MRWPHWTRTASIGVSAARRRRGKLTDAERRRRDEQFIPLEVGRLEERRVLAATPAITGAVNTLNSIAGTNNPTTAVSVLIAQNVTGASGIAVTHVDNSAGQWNYKLPGGTWQPINNFSLSNPGGVSTNNVLLLDSSDLLQFVPNNSAALGSYSLTFLAWNGSGTAGDRVDPTVNPGFFSSSSATTSVSVIQAMAIGGTGPATLSDTAAPISPFSSIQLTNNVDPAEDVTVTVTPSVLGAVGQLSIFGFTQNPGGSWTFTGTASAAQADLQNAATKFMPARVLSGASPTDTLTVTMGDSAGNAASPDSATVITVNGSATAPADPPTATFTAIANDIADANNVGESVAQLLTSPGTMLGIGVTSVDVGSVVVGGRNVAGGVWEFSTDNGMDWNSISGVSVSAPLLLAPNDLVRFVPNSHFVGTATLTYLTWDPAGGGMNGQPGDNSGDAGQQLFSADTADATIAVNPPLAISGTQSATTSDTTPINPFAHVQLTDTFDPTEMVTVTVTPSVVGAAGVLSIAGFTPDSNGIFTLTGTASAVQGELRTARFTPLDVLTHTTAQITYTVTMTDTAGNAATPDSGTVITVDGTVPAPADPPAATLPPIPYDISSTANSGESVANLLNSPGTMLGIGVTGMNVGTMTVGNLTVADGIWQFSTDSGATWNSITASTTAPLLLGPTDLVRFSPTNGFVGTATLTYLAWDPGSGGTDGQPGDNSADAGQQLFSVNSATATITVKAPLVISGTGTSTTLDTGVDHPFANISIVDNESADGPVTISFTILNTSNALGTLSISADFVQSGNTWTFTDGSLATALTDLQNATFTPEHVLQGDTAKLFISLTATDVTTQDTATDTSTEVDVTGTTTVATPPDATLPSITNSNTTSAGESVTALLGNPADPSGIAVTGVNDNGGGTWQYFLTGTSGAMWTDFPAGVAPGSAVLLTSADLVRFVPTAGFVGTATLNYQAWDPGSGGTNGQTEVDVSGNPNDMVFSIGAAATATITVKAPLVISGTGTSTTLDTGVDHPFANISILDNDNTDGPVTISFTMLNTSNALGTLSISPDFVQSGNTWTFTDGSLATALTDLQNATFTPDHVLQGDTAKLFISLTVTDVTTQDAATVTNTEVDVTGTMAAPSLAAGNLTAIVQGASTNGGTAVSQLLGSTATPSGESLGIAVTGVDDTNGVWEYSIGGGPWTAFTVGGTGGATIGATTASFPSTAVLLSSADSVRFVPNSPAWAGISSITFVAYDTLSGGADGGPANVSGNPNDMVFSASGSSKIPVIGPPSIPSQTILVPVGVANGITVGTVTAGQSNFSFLTELGDTVPAVSYLITGGTSSAAFHIDPVTGAITVVNSAAITYSATPLVLTVTASYTTTAGLTGTAMTLTSPQVNTTTIELWQVTTSATQISAEASTTLTVNIQFDGPATQAFAVSVNWGDGSVLNPSLTPGTYNFTHIYPTNPNKSNPSAAIPIDVTVSDFQEHSIAANTQAAVPGTGFPDIAVAPPSTSSVVLATTQVLIDSQVMTPPLEPVVTQENDLGLAPAEVVTTTGRQVSLRIVSANGAEGDDINVPDPDQALNDLPKLFSKLPDGRYRVYLSEDGRTRLVIDVVVRQGRPVDPSEDSNGTSERPPTGEIQYGGADNVAADTAEKQSTGSPPPSTTGPSLPQLPPPPIAPVNGQQSSASTSDGAKTAPGFDAEVVPSTKSALPVSKPAPDVGAGTSFERHGPPGHQSWEAAAAGVGVAALLLESRSPVARERSERVDELMSHSNRKTFSAAARLARKLRRAVKE